MLYTDGLNEAENPEEEEFGMERLEETIRDVTTLNASDVPAAVLASIAEFERGSHANDDKTLVVLRRT